MSEAQAIETAISDVVVFLDGARVTRSGRDISLEKGINELKLEKISMLLDKDSIRVKGTGKGIKATLVDVEVNYVYEEVTGHEKLDELQARLKELEKEETALDEQRTHVDTMKDNYSRILDNFSTEFPKFFAAGESDIQSLRDFDTLYSDKVVSFQKQFQDIDDRIERNEIETEKVRREIGKLGGGAQEVEEYYDIVVSIEADGPGLFELDVTYQIRGASWTPLYDVQIAQEDTTIAYRANIINQTLEDWDEVSLEVSTATFKPVRIIEPTPWYIQEHVDTYPVAMAKAELPPMKRAKEKEDAEYLEDEEMLSPVAASAPPPEPEAEFLEEPDEVLMEEEQAALSETGFGVQSFRVGKKTSIKADGSPHPVILQSFDVESSRIFYWNSVDQQLIAQEKIKNGEITLLPGKAKCYVEGDFVGETELKVISPGEEFKLGTRLSYELKVEKKLIKREVGKKGIMKGKIQNDYSYEIKINNYRKSESAITVIDQIPHSRSADIVVEPDEKHVEDYISPKPEKFSLSIATWKLKLKPEEEFKIKHRFSVNYRKDLTVEPPLP